MYVGGMLDIPGTIRWKGVKRMRGLTRQVNDSARWHPGHDRFRLPRRSPTPFRDAHLDGNL